MVTRTITIGIIASVIVGIALGMHYPVSEGNTIVTESFDSAFADEDFELTYDIFDNPPNFFGTNIVVSSPGKSVDGIWGAGNISVIDTDTNSLLYTIHNPEPDKNSRFGRNIGISDSYILVAVHGKTIGYDDYFPAKIYVFDGKTGNLLHTIKNPNDEKSDTRFHSAFSGIGAVGDTIVAGSYFDEFDDFPTHIIHVFDGKTGSLLYTMDSPIPGSVSFGEKFESFDGKIAVHTRDEDPNDKKSDDAIHVFDGKTGSLLYTITDPETDFAGDFGSRFIIVNDKIVVSMPMWHSDNYSSGVIHVFDGKTGSLLYTINDPRETGINYDKTFGNYIAPAGDNIAVRSNEMVYVFKGNTGELLHTVDHPNLTNVELEMIMDLPDDNDEETFDYFFVILVVGIISGAVTAGIVAFKRRK